MVFDAQPALASATPVLALRTWPSGARYWFDHAHYDAADDRLHLSYGPPTAAIAHPTHEGHVVHIAAPAGYVCGLVVHDVRGRLARRGRIDLTLHDLERVSLSVEDVANALSASRTAPYAGGG